MIDGQTPDGQKPDTLTLTVRLHDPKEKQDASKSTAWTVTEVTREDLGLTPAAFCEKYLQPAAAQILERLKR